MAEAACLSDVLEHGAVMAEIAPYERFLLKFDEAGVQGYWLGCHTEDLDDGSDYCGPCATKRCEAANENREDEETHHFLDGGWDVVSSCGPKTCSDCGDLLDYRYDENGFSQELADLEDCRLTNETGGISPSDGHSLLRMIEHLKRHGPERLSDARRLVDLLRQIPLQAETQNIHGEQDERSRHD